MHKSSLVKVFKKIIIRLLDKLNLELFHKNKLYYDLRDKNISYRAFLQYDKPILVNLPLDKARWKVFPLKFNKTHPFVYSIKKATSKDSDFLDENILRNELSQYYQLVQPKCMSEVVGVESIQKKCNTHAVTWPWINDRVNKQEGTPVKVKNRLRLLSIDEHGVQHWGPVSKQKLDTEVFKFSKLYSAIKKNGYKDNILDNDGVVRCVILENNIKEWIWVPIQGQHRVSIASVLELKNITTKVLAVYRESDSDIFPQVLNGVYSENEAKALFNTYFLKEQNSSLFDKYISYTEKDNHV